MWGLPEAASAHAADIDQMISFIHWFMLALFIGWGSFMTYCLFRFSAKRNPKADYHGVTSHKSAYVEAGIVAVEAVLLIGFAFPLWGKWVGNYPMPEESERIKIVAEQFAWNIHYPGADGKFGKTSIDLIDIESNPLGLDRAGDPHAADDVITLNQLHLPVDKPAMIELSSKDVIHSFKIVSMRVTQDAIPGLEIPVSFTPTKTGNWEIACAQLCGIGHYRMKGFVTVHSKDDYAKWMEGQVAELAEAGDEDSW